MNNPTMFMLVGISGSGKSYIANTLNCPIVSSDSIRLELFGDESVQDNPNKVFGEVNRRIKNHLANGSNVTFDATNLSAKRRKAFLAKLPANVNKVAIVVATDLAVVLEQNKERARHVPEDVIMKMYHAFQFPEVSEGFNEIRIITHEKNLSNVENALARCSNFEQDNPHHKETLDSHLNIAEVYVWEQRDMLPQNLQELTAFAAKVHDIGKPDTKTYIKPNGKVDTVAHYYNHENVGAYLLSCMKPYGDFTKEEWAKIICLVQHHMDGYPYKGDGNYEKFGKQYGEEMKSAIRLIHEADMYGH